MGKKRLLVLLPWLGATPSAVKKYENLYCKDSFDVFVHYTSLKDFLWPKSGLRSSLQTLEELGNVVKCQKYSDIVVHAFSIGCYYYSLMIYKMRQTPRNFGSIWNLISAQIFDSPVVGSTSEMATGVATMITENPITSSVFKCTCLLYFAMTSNQTVSYYDTMIDEVKFHAPLVPTLLLTSTGDPMSVIKAFNEVCDVMEKSRPTTRQIWERSSHVEHLRYHYNEYLILLRNIIRIDSELPRQSEVLRSKL